MKTGTTVDQIRAGMRCGVPIIGVTTADQPAFVLALQRAYDKLTPPPPIVQHDLIRGVQPVNAPGSDAVVSIAPADDVMGSQAAPLTAPTEALAAAIRLPGRSVFIVHNAGALLDNAAVVQACCNLRDKFKEDQRMLILLDAALSLPPVLAADVLTLEDPLPSEAVIAGIIENELANAQGMNPPPAVPDAATKQRSVEALSGLSAFACEQSVALSLVGGALDPVELWNRKRRYVSQTRGLSIDAASETFERLGGLETAKAFGRSIFAGRGRPRAVVRIDEIEKMIGTGQDTSGVSQDALGTILREMEDNEWAGLIAVGPPGSGKSAYSKALGTSHGAPTFALDLGAAKGSLVGQSEGRIRTALAVIKAVAANGAFFVATCNKLDALPPELRRRFRYGLWFFDLPTGEERESIWTLQMQRFGLNTTEVGPRPPDRDWTGADIRNVCELSWRMNCTLIQASAFIVPVAVSDPASIERLRQAADGKFLSASAPGPYRHAKGSASMPPIPSTPSFSVPGRAYGES